jgi:hypothetical protein
VVYRRAVPPGTQIQTLRPAPVVRVLHQGRGRSGPSVLDY